MAIHNNAVADVKADLYATIPPDGTVITLMGNNTRFDIAPVDYVYDSSSSVSDNYPDVIKPTLQTGNGRFIKKLFQQYQSDWNQSDSSSPDFIQNKPSLPSAPTVNTGVSRSLDTSFQPSTTQLSQVNYTVQIAATLSLSGGQTGTVFLETSPNNSTWTEIGRFSNGNTGTLTIGLNTTQTLSAQISTYVPANYYVRLRTNGTATMSYITGQEILF